jgi:flagellar biosynthesis protein FlhG
MHDTLDLPIDQEAFGRPRARRIAIASGKGGVGKTWFAITLAHALAKLERRVLLFDGDLGLANIDIQLGLAPETDLGAVIGRRCALRDAALKHEAGFSVIAGRSGSGSLAGLPAASLERLLGELSALEYSDVLLDLGAGLDAATRRMAAWSDVLLVVATDEPTSLTDAYAVLKLHAADRAGSPGERPADVRIVVNQASGQIAGRRTFATLSRASQHFLGLSPGFAGIVRRDERVRDAIRRQTPLLSRHPGAEAAEDVRAIALGLT